MSQSIPHETAQTLNVIAGILLRCFIINVVALLFVMAVVLVTGDLTYHIYASMFDLTASQYDVLLFDALIFIKSLGVVFFLFPWVAIRLMLRSGQGRAT
jgi:hypothetical protein